MTWNERSRESWQARSEEWDSESDGLWQSGPRAEMYEFLRRFLGTAPLRVLDLGCGPGASTLRLKQDGYDPVGTDQAPGMVDAARRRGVDAVVSNGDSLPFPDGSFDAVFACTSLEWCEDPHRIIKEIVRVTKPGGRVVAVTLGPAAKPRWFAFDRLYGKPVNHNMMMPWELHRLMEEHGLQVIEMAGAYPLTLPQEAISAVAGHWQWQASLAFLWGFGAVKREA